MTIKMVTQSLLNKLIERKDLTQKEAMFLMEEMLRGSLTPSQMGAFLVALRMKGETEKEILGFIKVMRKHMVKIKTSGIVIDTCGTGGDGSGTFNISTSVALVVAGAGVKVAKHGNRAASSKCGSADVLEALGININLTPIQAERLLEATNFTFLFAPLYHPAMKNVSSVRKELGIRTVFNFLGPFVSPAQVKRQIIGVPSKNLAQILAKVAVNIDYDHLLIVTSNEGLDEISISCQTLVIEIKGKHIKERIINPKDYGFKKYNKDDLKGGDAKTNSEIIKRILKGERGAGRDVVLLNSAAALYVAGKAKNMKEGLELSQNSIDSGRAKEVLEKTIRNSLMV